VAIDEQQRVGSAELDRLAQKLAPPCQLGAYAVEGLIARTSTALILVVRGGAFGSGEGVLKVTGKGYAPILQRELQLLSRSQEAGVGSVVTPLRSELETVELDGEEPDGAVAIVLPLLSGGDLVQLIGAHTAGARRLGSSLALEVGEQVGTVLKGLLCLPRPIVYGDVKPQNVLLPRPGAPIAELVLIDLDASREFDEPVA
jgi:serine/threonine protein kinase